MRLLLRFLSVSLFAIWSSAIFASWVGVFLYRGVAFDHIHVSVSEDKNIHAATMLNIWNDSSTYSVTMENELKSSSKFILFHSNESKEKIVSEWIKEYNSNLRSNRSLTSINCAFATTYLLNDVLKLGIENNMVMARAGLFLWLPNMGHGIPLPDSVYKRLIKNFNKSKTTYYTKKTLKQLSASALLDQLQSP